jgi:hypothetical protein
MNESMTRREQVEKLAEEFAERYRHGERPSVEDYVAAHPEYAAEIRELFPAPAAAGGKGPGIPLDDILHVKQLVGRLGAGLAHALIDAFAR